jgi:hypothetical protein
MLSEPHLYDWYVGFVSNMYRILELRKLSNDELLALLRKLKKGGDACAK